MKTLNILWCQKSVSGEEQMNNGHGPYLSII